MRGKTPGAARRNYHEADPVVDTAAVRVSAAAGTLRLTKRARRHVVPAEERATFDLTERAGERAPQDVTLCDRLPAGLSLVSAPGAAHPPRLAVLDLELSPRRRRQARPRPRRRRPRA